MKKLICVLVNNRPVGSYFPPKFLLEGRFGIILHNNQGIRIDKAAEINANIQNQIPFHPGIDGQEFEIYIKDYTNVKFGDVIEFEADVLVVVKSVK